MLKPNQNDLRRMVLRANKSSSEYLGCYLICDVEKTSAWSCRARSSLTFVAHDHPGNNLKRGSEDLDTYSNNTPCWGMAKFISKVDLKEPSRGFVKDNKITLMVEISADLPTGL